MSPQTRRILVLLVGLAPAAGLRAGEAEVGPKVEEYMQARVERDRFRGSILVARDGQVLVRRGYGMANLEHDVANTPETKFRLGSLTKQFTAMAVMILQERGKLDVREKVKAYLPDCPEAWGEVTVHHLLTHTSGIPSYTDSPDYPRMMRTHLPIERLVAGFKDKPLEFRPGEKFKYSNSGYAVLGLLIDKVSGKPYASFLKEAMQLAENVGQRASELQLIAAESAFPPTMKQREDFIALTKR